MEKQYKIMSVVALLSLMVFLTVKRNQIAHFAGNNNSDKATESEKIGTNQSGESHSGRSDQETQSASNANSESGSKNSNALALKGEQQNTPPVKENDCFRFAYQHQPKNQNRDIEDFLNDTNAFPIIHNHVNQKSVCVKVNDKPVNHKFSKKGGKTEVLIGSVVGPESTIQVSYCVGNAPCKEACAVKTKNKVDELLSDSEMGGLENAELESQVKELRNVASVHGDLMDSAVIRDWNQLQSKEWVCSK